MHPNSFIDDFVLGKFLPHQLYFLARGDVFNTPLKRFLLRQMYMLPVYRAMDNLKEVSKNELTFKKCHRILEKKGTLLIHSEGVCVDEKRVRPLKKGTARIAFGAEEAAHFKLGVQIVPVSLNYSKASNPREHLMVEFSDPILVNEFEELYKKNQPLAYQALNNKIYNALTEKAVIIENKKTEPLAEQLLEIHRNNTKEPLFPIVSNNPEPFKLEKQVTQYVNTLYKTNEVNYTHLESLSKRYFSKLHLSQLTDKSIAQPVSTTQLYLSILALVLWSPLFAIGYLLHIFPVFVSKKTAQKSVKSTEFYASVFVSLNWLFFLMIYAVTTVISVVNFGFSGVFYVLAAAIIGFYTVFFWEYFEKTKQVLKRNRILKSKPDLIEELQLLRQEIVNQSLG